MVSTYHTELGIELIAQNESSIIFEGEETSRIAHNGEHFIVIKPNEVGYVVQSFETFSCCVAYIHGGLSEQYLNSYDPQNEQDTDENLNRYRNMNYAILIDSDSKMKVVSFERHESFEFIHGYIDNIIGCCTTRDLKNIDIFHDDEFLLRSDIAELSPSLLLLSEKREYTDPLKDTTLFGRLVLVSHDDEGETVGLSDDVIQHFLDTVQTLSVKNQNTEKRSNVLVVTPQ